MCPAGSNPTLPARPPPVWVTKRACARPWYVASKFLTTSLRVTEKTAIPSPQKSILDLLFGRPLSSEEDVKERIGPAAGIPVFGLDALSSAAYGPEAALTILIPLGLAVTAH